MHKVLECFLPTLFCFFATASRQGNTQTCESEDILCTVRICFKACRAPSTLYFYLPNEHGADGSVLFIYGRCQIDKFNLEFVKLIRE